MSDRLKLAAAAAYLGMSKSSLKRNVEARLIPFIDPPFGPVVFERVDLDAFLRSHRHDPAAEPLRPVGDLVVFEAGLRHESARRRARRNS